MSRIAVELYHHFVAAPAQEIALALAMIIYWSPTRSLPETIRTVGEVMHEQGPAKQNRIKFLASKLVLYWKGEISITEIRKYFPAPARIHNYKAAKTE